MFLNVCHDSGDCSQEICSEKEIDQISGFSLKRLDLQFGEKVKDIIFFPIKGLNLSN